MLIFSRKLNQKIMISDDICITVISIKKGQVQIGIDAPRSVPVHRHEIYEELKEVSAEAETKK